MPPPAEDDHPSDRARDRAFILGLGEDDVKQDSVKDAQAMVRTIVMGLHTLFFCISTEKKEAAAAAGQQPPPASPATGKPSAGAPAGVLHEEEVRLISKVFVWALQCMPVFRMADEVGGRAGGSWPAH
jgi:hypothetical protein